MLQGRLVVINCGETTCASEPGKFCPYVRTTHFGTRWHCHLYEKKLLEDEQSGWLQRHAQCMADFHADVVPLK